MEPQATAATFTCIDCRETKPCDPPPGGPGYGRDNATEDTVCYECCGKRDAAAMTRDGKITLYWDGKCVTNWPGTLRFTPHEVKTSRHNWAHVGKVTTAYFRDMSGALWSARHAGEWNTIARCRRLKRSRA